MTKNLILVGAGGHAKACIEVIESTEEFTIKGLVDQNAAMKSLLGYPILGKDELIDQQATLSNTYFLITVGQIKSAGTRIKIFEHITNAGGQLATIIAASAVVSARAKIGAGTIVMQQVLVNADAVIGENVILNNKALIEHDCRIGDHVHISTGALINGACTIGNSVFIGSGAVIKNGISICDDVIIGAASYVRESITKKGIYAGNPAQRITVPG